jgi:hypothetical protein
MSPLWKISKNGLKLVINFGRKGLPALTPEIDSEQTAMGLPLVTSTVFLTAK